MHQKLPQFEDIFTIERLTRCDFSVRRNLIAWSSTQSEGIILQNVSDGTRRAVAEGDPNAYYPVFSPDDNCLLYLTREEETCCLMVYSFADNHATCLLHTAAPIIDPRWSPDGHHILYAAVQQGECVTAGTAEPVVIEDLGYKFDGIGFRRPSNTVHLFIVDVNAKSCRCITTGTHDYLHHNWCMDSRHVVCVSNVYRSSAEYLGYDLIRIDIQTGDICQLTHGLWIASYPSPIRPVCTPDGHYVIAGVMDSAYADKISTGTFPQVYLYRIGLDDFSQERIFTSSSDCYQCAQFPYNATCGSGMDTLQVDESGRYALFHSGWQGQGGLFRMDLLADSHPITAIGRGKYAYNGISRVCCGKLVVARCSDTEPEGYFLVDVSSGSVEKKLVQSAEDYLCTTALSTAQDFFAQSRNGTDRIHGWVLPPAAFDEKKQYPAIFYIHGGPHPFYTYAVDMELQAFAAQGFAVLYCNPRGSSGYGWKHQNWGDARCAEPFEDCMDFLDDALRRFPWIDEKSIGVTGGSYGGYMTSYIATHSRRFCAYICQRGVYNGQILYASSDETGYSGEFYDFGSFMRENLKKSAVAYVDRINAPFLILHGADDCRTPVEAAVQMYHALRDVNPDLPTKLVLYPHTGHSQPRERTMRLSYYREMLQWFTQYLLPGGHPM